MAGALAPQPPDPFEDAAPRGALSSANGQDYQDEGYPADYNTDQGDQPSADESYYRDTARQLLGGPEGPLAQSARLKQSRDAAAQTKLAAIERAKANLRLLGSYAPNPFREMMAGLGQNTKTGRFGESVGNALAARQHGEDALRGFNTNMTGAVNELELAGGQVPWDVTNLEQQEADRQQRLGTQFATMAEREQTVRDAVRERRERANADREQRRLQADATNAYRDASLEQRRQHDEDVNRQKEMEAQFSTWIGTNDEGYPVFQNKLGETRTGTTKIGAKPTASDAALTPLQKNARYYVQIGAAPDEKTAVAMLRQSVSDPATFQRLVQAEKKIIMTNNFGITDAQAETLAQQNVKSRATVALAPAAAPSGARPGAQPAPAAAPSAAPAAAPQQAPVVPAASAPGLPPQVRSTLKPGIGTTVRSPDGQIQTWTLQNGQPVRVK